MALEQLFHVPVLAGIASNQSKVDLPVGPLSPGRFRFLPYVEDG